MFAFKSIAVVAALVVSSFAIPVPDAGTQLQNGKDAIALNDKFKGLTADSSCTPDENACINGQFAKCDNAKFVLMPCGAGTTCVALPLVNSPGTSVTCGTEADKDARIAATGASGGGSSDAGPAAASPSAAAALPAASSAAAAAPAPAPAPANNAAPASGAASGAKSFTLQNGKDAQALNAKFVGLTKDSSCTAGENACIGDDFAQCVDGKFVTTPCVGATCAALPLVNSAGTSITCTDKTQALQRIQATGAGNSLTGQ